MLDYKDIFDASPVAACMLATDGTILSANPAFCQLLGYPETELRQMPFLQLIPAELHQTRRQNIEQILAGDMGSQLSEHEYVHKAGHTLWLVENRSMVRSEQGQTDYFICQFQDISQRRQEAQRLQLIEERYNLSQRHASFGVWDWNIQTNELYGSEQIGPLLGFADGEIEANYADFLAAIHPEDRDYVSEAVRAAVEDHAEYDIEHRVVWPDGSIIWHHVTGDVIRDNDGTPLNMIGVTQDVTARHNADEKLKQNAEQLKHAQQIAHMGHWSWDVASGKLYWSDEIYRIFGYQPGEIEPTYEHFIATLHPDDIEPIKQSDQKAFAEGKPHSLDHHIIRQDGSEAWVHEEAITITDAQGQPVRLAGTVQDITERKQLEQQLADKMEQAEAANFAKSTFLSHMSHELRTPLNVILGFAQVLDMEDLPDTVARGIKEIMGSGWHLLDLVDDLLDLSRIETGNVELQIEAVDVRGLIEECQSMIAPLLKQRKLNFILSYQDGSPSVSADRCRLKQIIVNLLSNAIKYNHTNGKIEVFYSQHNNRLRIHVRDTGQGIPEELIPRLFTPFDRLGKEGIEESGTGIGLSLVQRLAHNMDGEVGVESTVGKGSTFWVEFPQTETTNNIILENQNHYIKDKEVRVETITYVLCVEDNRANLRLIESFFARHEYLELMTASNATSGLEMAKAHKPDIILMDIKLPDMNGFEALTRLRSQPDTSNIPVIAISAIAHEHNIAAGLNAGFYRYLTKPLNLQELEEAMHYALHDARQELNVTE